MMTIMISECYKTKNLRYRYFNKERALQQTCQCKYTIVTDELIIPRCLHYMKVVADYSISCIDVNAMVGRSGILSISVQTASGED